METLIFTFILLALYHLVMEIIVLPVFKVKILYKIIRLRDQMINLKISYRQRFSTNLFHELDSAMVFTVNHADKIHILDLFLFSFKKHTTIMRTIKREADDVEKCRIEEVKQIFKSFDLCIGKILLVNLGASLLYLWPFLLMYFIIKRVSAFYKQEAKHRKLAFIRLEKIHYEHENVKTERLMVSNKKKIALPSLTLHSECI